MDDAQLRAQVQDRVVRFIAGVVLHNTEVASRVGLGASDAQFLTLLNVHGPLTPGRLAALSGLTTGSVTGVLDRLERAGFTRRERAEDDRRKVLVHLVPEGMGRMAEHYAEHGRLLGEVLARRDAGQLQVIADFLDELTGPS